MSATIRFGGGVGLGLALGFRLVLGSLFAICVATLLTGVALDIRDLRNDRGSSDRRA